MQYTPDALNIVLQTALPPLTGKPDNKWVTAAYKVTRANALAANPEHPFGYLRLTCQAATYTSQTGQVDFVAPPMPQVPVYPANFSAAAVAKADSDFNRKRVKHLHYKAVDRALCQQYVDTVPAPYISTLKNATFGFHSVTTLTMLEHLQDKYGKKTAEDLIANEERIQASWHPSTATMEEFWSQHEDGQQFALNTENPIGDPRLIMFATKTLRATDIPDFKLKLTEFEAKPLADRTWATFMQMMDEVYTNLGPTAKSPPTASSMGYHGANHVSEDKENVSLETPYCWSHGATSNPKHTSANCKSPFENHNHSATFTNRCGGCTKIMQKRGEVQIWKPRNGWRNRSDAANGASATNGAHC